MRLSQRGSRPRGYLSGGELFGMGNAVSGGFDGATFAGSFARWDRRNVSFKLRYTEERRLKGPWVIEAAGNSGQTGAWSFARIGPGPPAPRRR